MSNIFLETAKYLLQDQVQYDNYSMLFTYPSLKEDIANRWNHLFSLMSEINTDGPKVMSLITTGIAEFDRPYTALLGTSHRYADFLREVERKISGITPETDAAASYSFSFWGSKVAAEEVKAEAPTPPEIPEPQDPPKPPNPTPREAKEYKEQKREVAKEASRVKHAKKEASWKRRQQKEEKNADLKEQINSLPIELRSYVEGIYPAAEKAHTDAMVKQKILQDKLADETATMATLKKELEGEPDSEEKKAQVATLQTNIDIINEELQEVDAKCKATHTEIPKKLQESFDIRVALGLLNLNQVHSSKQQRSETNIITTVDQFTDILRNFKSRRPRGSAHTFISDNYKRAPLDPSQTSCIVHGGWVNECVKTETDVDSACKELNLRISSFKKDISESNRAYATDGEPVPYKESQLQEYLDKLTDFVHSITAEPAQKAMPAPTL